MTVDLYTSHADMLEWFQLKFPELWKTMGECTHHFDDQHLNPYHLEGTVQNHTMMVFLNSQHFSIENHHVKWSTLLHDIGKPMAREVVEKHVDFGELSDEEVYEKYKHLVDDFVDKEG
jgi:hypothetical protein